MYIMSYLKDFSWAKILKTEQTGLTDVGDVDVRDRGGGGGRCGQGKL